MAPKEPVLAVSRQDLFEHDHEWLRQRLRKPLRTIARQAVRVWFNRDRLDALLSRGIAGLESCELLFAIDIDGRQVSSNIFPGLVEPSAYGQDLARRPYAVNLSVLGNVAFEGAFLCDPYLSQATRKSCVTVMYSVTEGSSLLGYIAADFDPTEFRRG